MPPMLSPFVTHFRPHGSANPLRTGSPDGERRVNGPAGRPDGGHDPRGVIVAELGAGLGLALEGPRGERPRRVPV